jgi:ribosome-associated toxin RatA of RatAB toxin-antitoxin module
MKIKSNDGQEFIESKEQIFNVLSDFESYKKWWPKTIIFKMILDSPEIVGSKIKISPYGVFSFSWIIKEIYPNDKIVIKYSDGIYSGNGVWLLQKRQEKVYVDFSIEIESNNLVIKVVDRIFGIQKTHNKMMKKVFFGLHEYLNK